MSNATPSRFFESATHLLAERGVAGLTLNALCQETHVSTGSFYHHFGSWDRFVERFLAEWETQWTQRMVDMSTAVRDPQQRFEQLIRLAGEVPHAAECAIRAWAYSNPAVGLAQERVDAKRLAHLQEVLGALVGVDAPAVESLAAFVLAAYVGAELLHRQQPAVSVGAVLAEATGRVLALADEQQR